MNELALFAGAGGGLLGSALLGLRTVAAVEIEEYRREVLLQRQRDGVLPLFPIWDDVRTFDGRPWRGLVDWISMGPPCTPFSTAGKSLRDLDPRDCWPDALRVVGEVLPGVACMENSPAILARGRGGRPSYWSGILGTLAALGYSTVWDCLPAAALGAPHRRDRLWALSYANAGAIRHLQQWLQRRAAELGQAVARDDGPSTADADPGGCPSDAQRHGAAPAALGQSWLDLDGCGGPDAHGIGCGSRRSRLRARQSKSVRRSRAHDHSNADASVCARDHGRRRKFTGFSPPPRLPDWWSAEPAVGRVAHGVADRVDRLEALGDGQVPLVVAAAVARLVAVALREEQR